MDDATRHALLQLLGEAMSGISEECYYAGWLVGAEYFVPELCRRVVESGRLQQWGHGEVTPEKARGLAYLAEQLGYWANRDNAGTGYVPHRPFPVPSEYAEAIEWEQINASQVSRPGST